MAIELGVNSDGLRAAASSSDGIAADLASSGVDGGAAGLQPYHGGVTAILNVIESVSSRQSGRVAYQAGAMATGASLYDGSDAGSATAPPPIEVRGK